MGLSIALECLVYLGYPLNALVQIRDTAFDAAAYAIQADLMDQIKFQWYVEMYGEGFGYETWRE